MITQVYLLKVSFVIHSRFYFKKYQSIYNQLLRQIIITQNKKQLTGVTANQGKTKGIVKIISSKFNLETQFRKFKIGNILITQMTSPNYLPILNKAKAIITDEGGICSHASIISRELNIPCIIGTKVATQVLKDGDLVEVDANQGIVKKL